MDILLGATDYTKTVFIPDPASTDGSGKTGLVAANLTVSYTRVETDNDVTVTDVTSSLNNLAALTTAHTDWGLLEVSSTLAPGLYRLDFADAVFASGAWTAVVYVMITTSAAAASPIEFNLVDPAIVSLGVNVVNNAGSAITSAAGIQEVKVASIAANAITATAINADAITDAKVASDVTIASVTGAVGSVTGAVGSVTGAVGSVTGAVGSVAAGGITAASFAANAINAAKLDPDVTTELQAGLATQASVDDLPTNAELATALGTADDAVLAAIAALNNVSAAAVADAVWDEDATAHQTQGSFGQAIGDPAADTNTIYAAVVTGAAGATVAADIIAVKAETATILADTNELQTDWVNGGRLDLILDARSSQTSVDDLPTNAELATSLGTADDAVLAQVALVKAKTDLIPASPAAVGDIPTAIQNADALLDRDMSTGADNGSTTVRTPRQSLRFLRNKWSISGSTLTVTKENDSTASWTSVMTETPGADPITASDPAGP